MKIAAITLSVLLLATPGYPDSEEDIDYMKRTLRDAAAGCDVLPNPAVPGGYLTRGDVEETGYGVRGWYRPSTHYCIDVDVFNAGSCYVLGNSIHPGRVTLSVYPPPNSGYNLHSDVSEIVIQYQSTANDVAIHLGLAHLGARAFLNSHSDTVVWLSVSVTRYRYEDRRGSGQWYDVKYNPETETIDEILAHHEPAPEMAEVLREPLRKFFARLLSIVETGIVPAARPPVSCHEGQ